MAEMRLTWGAPYTKDQLDDVQAKWGLRFPPDLVALYLERRPIATFGHMIDWDTDSDDRIQEALGWPLRGFWFDVENNNLWWPEWGDKPADADDRYAALKAVFDKAPRLIPIYGHRYLPSKPHEAGNPVFSVWQADVIYYGADLMDYFERDFGDREHDPLPETLKEIPFWSLAERRNNE